MLSLFRLIDVNCRIGIIAGVFYEEVIVWKSSSFASIAHDDFKMKHSEQIAIG